MANRVERPQDERDKLHASGSFRELFRYKKARKTRSYNLRVRSDDKTELWVVTSDGGNVKGSRKLTTFDNPDEATPFLEDVERELRQGGWLGVS